LDVGPLNDPQYAYLFKVVIEALKLEEPTHVLIRQLKMQTHAGQRAKAFMEPVYRGRGKGTSMLRVFW
jgi:hypothetical protein